MFVCGRLQGYIILVSRRWAMFSRMFLAMVVCLFSLPVFADIMEAGTHGEALMVAEADGRRVYILFGGDHCPWCEKRKAVVFAPGMDDALSDFVLLRLDVLKDRELADRYGVKSIPVSIIVDSDGKVVRKRVGYMDESKFRDWLR